MGNAGPDYLDVLSEGVLDTLHGFVHGVKVAGIILRVFNADGIKSVVIGIAFAAIIGARITIAQVWFVADFPAGDHV